MPAEGHQTPIIASPRLTAAAASTRSEAEVRAIRARRARLEADLIEEGASDALVARLATDDVAERMASYERQSVDLIAGLFAGAR